MVYKNTRMRIEGTVAQIDEALRRLRHVCCVIEHPKLYDSRTSAEVKFCYLTMKDSEPDTLLQQLEAARRDVAQLESALGELSQELEALKAEKGLIPKPRAWDAVLSPKSALRMALE